MTYGIISVSDFGLLDPSGVSDNHGIIQDAINQLAASGNKYRLHVPPGNYKISSTLVIQKGFHVFGNGRTAFKGVGAQEIGTQLVWGGAAGGTMMEIAPVSGAANPKLGGMVLEDIGLFGNYVAGIGLSLKSSRDCKIKISIEGLNQYGVYTGVVPLLGESRGCHFNEYDITGRQLHAASGPILFCDGDETGNTCQSNFRRIWGLYKYSDAIVLGNTDTLSFDFVWVFRYGGGTGRGVVFKAGANNSLASRHNQINFLYPGDGGVYAEGIATAPSPSVQNWVRFYDKTNATPNPVRESGAVLTAIGTNGAVL